MTRRFFDRFNPHSKTYEEPMMLFTHPAHAAPRPEPSARQRKQAKWLAIGVVGFFALTIGLAAQDMGGESASGMDTHTTSVVDDLNAQMQKRIANASYDSYYRTLATVFMLPRSEMDEAIAVAPQVCYYAVTVGDTERAADYVRPIVQQYPSTYARDLRSGKEPNILNYSYADIVQMDAEAFVFNTTVDYCAVLGY